MSAGAEFEKLLEVMERLRSAEGCAWDREQTMESPRPFILEEAYELVEHEVITEEDFRDFVFTNPTTLWTGMNPNFFKGTVVEKQVDQLLAAGAR